MEATYVDLDIQNKEIPFSLEDDLQKMMGIGKSPYTAKLSFLPLLKQLEKRAKSKDNAEAFMANAILAKLEDPAFWQKPIDDPALLATRQDEFKMLMMSILPSSALEKQLFKVSAPFALKPVFFTPGLEKMMKRQQVKYVLNESADMVYCAMVINASTAILNKFYDQNLQVDPPISISVKDNKTGLVRHYKTQMDLQYIEIIPTKTLKPLGQKEINKLLSNIYDIDLWLKHIPPENFEFHGFLIGQLLDITEEETLSRIKFALLEKNAVVAPKNLDHICQLLRNYFGLPGLRFGITAIDFPLETSISHRYRIRFDFLADKHECLLDPKNANSIYEKVCKYREVLLVEDLTALQKKTAIEEDLINIGIKCIIVAPLLGKNDRVIGLLEIGTANPFELHSFAELKFKNIVSLFSMAVERSREEIDNSIEALIREQFTAIHPSVEWKFREVTFDLMEQREKDQKFKIKPIVFEDVFPLYGQADIVSSSTKRNAAIQADLIDNLTRARQLITKVLKEVQFPLLRQLLMKVNQDIENLNDDFGSGDESRIVELLHQDIHPVFRQLQQEHPDLNSRLSRYFDSLDPDLGIVYNRRKDYEESVAMLNDSISAYLDKKEKESQQVLPHYFEKYKTDGVEYDLYVGQSLLRRGNFSQIHLKNFRLWQLIQMCEITRLVKDMEPKLLVPLTTAQLVFAYTTPLSIRFRMDEKQFDVDGAYNVRYEILKKRIDKATVEGTGERLTVQNKIAIVYLQDKDRTEYLEYAKYLQYEGFITDDIEDLVLDKLQGVQGLRALRLTVKY